MKVEAILFYLLLLYIICCSIIFGIGVLNLDQYLVCVLIGCCIFLMYYVLRYIGTLLVKCASYLLDVLCKLFDWMAPFVKNVYYTILSILSAIVALGLFALFIYVLGWLFGDCSGHTDFDHIHYDKY